HTPGLPVHTSAGSAAHPGTRAPVTGAPTLPVPDPSFLLTNVTVQVPGAFPTRRSSDRVASPQGLSFFYNQTTGVLTLTSPPVTAIVGTYHAAPRTVTYTNSSFTPTTSPRTITFTAINGANSGSGFRTATFGGQTNGPPL